MQVSLKFSTYSLRKILCWSRHFASGTSNCCLCWTHIVKLYLSSYCLIVYIVHNLLFYYFSVGVRILHHRPEKQSSTVLACLKVFHQGTIQTIRVFAKKISIRKSTTSSYNGSIVYLYLLSVHSATGV